MLVPQVKLEFSSILIVSDRNDLDRQEAFDHTESSDEGFWED
jgi:type I site-specific restriction-modification system R (restriction) subunit